VPRYAIISNAVVGNTVCNEAVSHRLYAISYYIYIYIILK
jgi:hypothetical protein